MLITIDTGGTKTLISAFNASGKLDDIIKIPTPHDPSEYAKTLTDIVRDRYAHKQVEVIVLAIPGIVKDGVVLWCSNLPWENLPLSTMLKDMLPGVPLLIDNDAKLAGLGEARSLAKIPDTVLYVTISTGIGAGLIANGSIDKGMRFSEIGHMPLEYDGRIRTWESFASGKAITAAYKKLARDITSPRIWRQISDRMSRGFLVAIPAMQPDLIIIGGGIGTYFNRYGDFLTGLLKENLPPHIPCPRIVQAKHPEEAVLYGCYYYGKDYLASRAATKK